MQKKTLLLATFINIEELEEFFKKIYNKFGIKKNSVFIFDTENDGLLITYRLFLKLGEKINIKKELPKTIQVHKKGSTFFTINALNKLIERDNDLFDGNVNHSQYQVNWYNYENTLILLKNNQLEILQLKRKIVE